MVLPHWLTNLFSNSGPCDIVGDISYEELRSAAYDDARQGLSVQSIVSSKADSLFNSPQVIIL